MTIQTYKDVKFPFITEFADDRCKVCLLAAVVNEYAAHIIGYTYYGDDPTTSCSQVLEWDENGVFAGGAHPSMNLIPPPGVVETHLLAINAEIAQIRQRLDDNPDAPEAWRKRDEQELKVLERQALDIFAPHIWNA